jgi:hypothetical protein
MAPVRQERGLVRSEHQDSEPASGISLNEEDWDELVLDPITLEVTQRSAALRIAPRRTHSSATQRESVSKKAGPHSPTGLIGEAEQDLP